LCAEARYRIHDPQILPALVTDVITIVAFVTLQNAHTAELLTLGLLCHLMTHAMEQEVDIIHTSVHARLQVTEVFQQMLPEKRPHILFLHWWIHKLGASLEHTDLLIELHVLFQLRKMLYISGERPQKPKD
jgi:hypothetical protein